MSLCSRGRDYSQMCLSWDACTQQRAPSRCISELCVSALCWRPSVSGLPMGRLLLSQGGQRWWLWGLRPPLYCWEADPWHPEFRSDGAESCFAVGVGFCAVPGYRCYPSGAFCPSGRTTVKGDAKGLGDAHHTVASKVCCVSSKAKFVTQDLSSVL